MEILSLTTLVTYNSTTIVYTFFISQMTYAPFTRYNRLYSRFYYRLVQQENDCIHDAIGCPNGCTTARIVYTQL